MFIGSSFVRLIKKILETFKNHITWFEWMSKGTVLVTGSQGFIGSYVCGELLGNDYEVIGVDNFSKYGKVVRSHDNHQK